MGGYWPNAAHWHLLINHFPIMAFACAFLILFISEFSTCCAWRKVGWFLTFVAAASLYLIFATGERAADMVSKLEGISKDQIDLHYNKAILAIWCAGVTGVLALLAFLGEAIRKMCLARPFRWIILLGVFSSLVFFTFAAYEGANIHHPEIKLPAVSPEPHPHTHNHPHSHD